MRVVLELSDAAVRLEGSLDGGDSAGPVVFSGVLGLVHAIEQLRSGLSQPSVQTLDAHEENER